MSENREWARTREANTGRRRPFRGRGLVPVGRALRRRRSELRFRRPPLLSALARCLPPWYEPTHDSLTSHQVILL
jgi:hypothetical protein